MSNGSPLTVSAKKAFSSKSLWSIDEKSFKRENYKKNSGFVEADLIKTASEYKSELQEMLENTSVHTVDLSDFQLYVDENAGFSEQMSAIAGNVNMCYATGNEKGMADNLVTLYNKVHGYNSHKLKTLDPENGQVVGLAFIKMALYFDNGDFQVNEIAAQNAYYSIAKNYLGTRNTCVLPALFTLLCKKPQTLIDELYRVNPDPSLYGLGGMTPSAPYIRKKRAMENRLPIMRFLLENFYDIQKKEYKLDSTLPYHIPSISDINIFLEQYKQSESVSKSLDLGLTYFKSLYEDIEEQLNL